MLSLVAFFIGLASLILLYYCWRKAKPVPYLVTLSWLLALLSVVLWVLSHNLIFGVCFALIALSLQAWFLIALNSEKRAPKNEKRLPRTSIHWDGLKALPKHLGRAVSVVPLSGVSAMQLTTVTTGWLPWHSVNLMALGIYIMPLAWGALAYWSVTDTLWWRPVAANVAVIGVCSWAIYL